MKKQLSIGIQGFDKLRTEDYYYIDKSDFISEWWENGDDVTLITRPRRFGKTLNMDMVRCFFSNHYKDRGDLFEGLSIWKDEKYRKLQGAYPVIFLSFAGIKETTLSGAKFQIKTLISRLYQENHYLTDSDLLSNTEKKSFENITPYMEDSETTFALNTLCMYLTRYYNQKSLSFWMNMTLPCRKPIWVVTGMSLLLLSAACSTPLLKQILIWNGQL